ncbi:rab-GTPase-TBC domain-containing protein [Crassisporium funariophilum]|nr:rab-GTPase-TBC domain-containing protein [Crassisporium funariophilum]
MLSKERLANVKLEKEKDQIDWKALRVRSLEPRGFGEDRVEIWPKLLNVPKPKPQPEEKPLKELEDVEEKPHEDERQIGLDTDRSFVLYPVGGKHDRETLQTGLHELLVSLFRKRPRLSYFQGYHDIVTVFFLTLPQELQLMCIEKLSLHRVRDSMGAGLEPVLGLLRVTKNLLRLADPEYAEVLEQSSPLPFYALSNLLTLFSHDTPTLPLIQHVFDYLLCRPPIAAVYLATTIILSRKVEVLRLLEEEEEGMVHSLLSSLPDIVDHDGDNVDEDSSVDLDNTFFKEERLSSPMVAGSGDILSESLDQITGDAKKESGNPELSFTPAEEIKSHAGAVGFGAVLPETEAEIKDSPLEGNNQYLPKTSVDHSGSSSTISETSAHAFTPSFVKPIKLEADDDHPPAFSAHPKPTRLALTDLLKHADALYDQFPPSCAALSLSSIMGPQSVVFTWSESPSSLPSDNMAEAMVSHPELIVYPYIEPEPDHDKEESEMNGKQGRKAHRKRRKLRKSPFGQLEKKTLLAGTVLVLGVAMAVYGIKASRSGPGGHGLLYSFTDGHAHTGVKDWKRLGGWVGGAFVGMSTKIMNGLSLGS